MPLTTDRRVATKKSAGGRDPRSLESDAMESLRDYQQETKRGATMTTRREILVGAAALATYAAARKAGAATTGFNDQDYRRAIVIDGLGGFDDPYGPPGMTIIDPRGRRS